MEIWKPIPGYEGYYEASTEGRIRSVDRDVNHGNYTYTRKGRLRIPFDNQGYDNLTLNKDKVGTTFPVHRLIAMTFISNPENKPCVNHIDGNKRNNCVENLEWATYSENSLHALEHHLVDIEAVRANALKGADASSIRVMCEDTGEVFGSIIAACRRINSECIVSNIHANRRSHRGKGWLFTKISEDYYQLHKNDSVDEEKCNRIHQEIRSRIGRTGKATPIYCVERDIHYQSISAAAKDNNMDNETINLAIKEHRKAKGLTFVMDK